MSGASTTGGRPKVPTARSRSTDKRFYGVAEALVTDNDDPEHEGRVKVTFPWFDASMESEWCRVRQSYAGNDYGAFFVPEVGDEVLVAFVHGDMRLPVILGGLYNGQDKPPSFREGTTKDQKLIRTKGKHEILLDDSKGEERVRIQTQGGHVLDLDDKEKNVTVKTSGGHAVVLDDQGTKVSVQTSAGQSVLLEDGGAKITVQTSGGQSITLEGGQIKLAATSIILTGQVKLGGDAAASSLVLGEALLTAFNTHTHGTAVGPTTPPVPPMTPAVLSKTSKTS
jgi:uncharacterized protein involved in type VI secretion and phage assembly